MSGFLDSMAQSSAERAAVAASGEPMAQLRRRANAVPAPPALRLSPHGFDVIAEIKLRSPAAGQLGAESDDWLARALSYGRGGAAAVSVLTEPSRFDGSLQHLQHAAAALQPLGVPVMRKDFLVDPYQVAEARAAGAGGVLLIVRMLPPQRLQELLDAAAEFGLFVLLEAFDGDDLAVAAQLLRGREQRYDARCGAAGQPPLRHIPQILVGINCRDLQTLQVVPERFAALAPLLPEGWPAVAESGVACAADAKQMLHLGYRLALIGTALMTCARPEQALSEILAAARTVNS